MKTRSFLFLFLLLATHQTVTAQLRISKLFSDHAVLQRDQPIKVWGWTNANSSVSVFFNDKKQTAHANITGKWMVTLPSMPMGGPYEMQIKNDSEEIILKDILLGDVWICSGQSNMEWTVANSQNAESEIENANDNKIRHFKIPHSFSKIPEEELAGGEWKTTNSGNVGDFTGVGYFFARELRQHVDVPIGLLNTSWGGSRIEPWMSAGTLDLGNPELAVEKIMSTYKNEHQRKLKIIKERFPDISEKERGRKNGKFIWNDETQGLKGWIKLSVPNTWESQGFEGFDGIAWYRTTFNLTAEEAKESIKLGLGKIDDSDITWVNGKKVGEIFAQWNKERVYKIPANILKAGKNTIAIRVEDTGGGGGIHGTEDLLFIKTNKQKMPLAGNWYFRLDALLSSNSIANANQIPTLLYNKMIFPIKDFGIKGALWYQGESNAGSHNDATKYEKLFADMIKGWRKDFGGGDFPFLFVQLANWLPPQGAGVESHWATLRASQTNTLKVNNTAQAVIIDIGEEEDIHPQNKQDVGLRLSLAARNLAYGQDVLFKSPMYKNHKIKDGKILITFQNTGKGLMVKNKYGYINGFTIAGEDGKFVWARAKLIGQDRIMVWSEKVEQPKSLRYAWADNPNDVNLYNSEDLPACPFKIGE